MYTTLHDPTTNYPLRNALAMVTSHHTVRRHVPFANRIVDLDLLDAHPETEPVNYYTLSVTTIASPSRRV